MKIQCSISDRARRGIVMLDLAIALGLLTTAMMPLVFAYAKEMTMLHAEYDRAVVMEIVDGEAEVLAAGAGKNYPEGTQAYVVHLKAAVNLPPGHFQLTRTGNHLRLEWRSDRPKGIGPMVRELTMK